MAAITHYQLLGHEVDKATYEKYANRKYSFMDRHLDLSSVHFWATSSEIAEKLPEYADEARKIITQIESEIGVQAKSQTMQKKNFHSFLEGLQAIYREELANYNAAHDAFEIARKEYEATKADRNAPEHIKLIASGDFERAKLAFEQSRLKAQNSYNARVKELRQQMAEFTANLYRATPDRVDQSAMQLLNTGIMSVDEMDHLASQYRDNPPMMRIIGEYALKKAESFGQSERDKAGKYMLLGQKLSNITDNGNALAGFDQMADYGSEGLGKEATIARNHGKNWDRMYAGICAAYDDFIVQPSGGSEE